MITIGNNNKIKNSNIGSDNKYKKILTELEKWLKINDKYSQGYFKQVLDYIDVLKEKYSLGGKENE